MGQGLYDLLGWGVLDPPVQVDPNGYVVELAEMFPLLCAGTVHDAYETEPLYLVLPLAVSDAWLQEYWHLPPLPDWVPRVEARRARTLDSPEPAVFAIPAPLQERWTLLQGIYQRAGMVLPDARLVILNDWD